MDSNKRNAKACSEKGETARRTAVPHCHELAPLCPLDTWRDPALAQQKVQGLERNSTDLPSLKILYKQVLLTGLTSEMAFLFPGTHQERRGIHAV